MSTKLLPTCFAVCAVIFAVMSRGLAAEPLTVIELQHRSADELLPVLRQLAGDHASISGVDYKLLVRGTPEQVAQLREAVAVLDYAPRQLRVSVRYLTEANRGGGNAKATVGNQGATVAAGTSLSTMSDAAVSSVQVLEGNSAHISDGTSVPVVTAAYVANRRKGEATGVELGYRDVMSGMTVTPRVNGDRVMLEIASQQQRTAGSANAGVATQNVTTTVAARLGQWTELGGVTESGSSSNTGIALNGATLSTRTQADRRTIEVKVDILQ